MRQLPLLIASLLTLAAATRVAACPVCDSETGEQVRAGLADDSVVANVMAITLPFLVVGGVVAAVHFWPPKRGR